VHLGGEVIGMTRPLAILRDASSLGIPSDSQGSLSGFCKPIQMWYTGGCGLDSLYCAYGFGSIVAGTILRWRGSTGAPMTEE
jgi:hypothetical protein